ncbi:MAG TPA: hypothetical protein VFD74_09110 [Thermoleophilia bacterium]|nr:hypothetical protein [Thermoleophilia bacterium]
MKKLLKFFGFVSILGSAAVGVYYFFFMRKKKPSVELYFDDGSMLAFDESASEAGEFLALADDVLALSPVIG